MLRTRGSHLGRAIPGHKKGPRGRPTSDLDAPRPMSVAATSGRDTSEERADRLFDAARVVIFVKKEDPARGVVANSEGPIRSELLET